MIMRPLLVLLTCATGFVSCHEQEPEIISDTYAHNFVSIADPENLKMMDTIEARTVAGQFPALTPPIWVFDWPSFLRWTPATYRMPGKNTGSVYIPPPLDLRTTDTSGTPRVYINE